MILNEPLLIKISMIYDLVYGYFHGKVWYDMVWYGMVWYGMVWYGMI